MKLTIEISKSTFDRIERMRKYDGNKTGKKFLRTALRFFLEVLENQMFYEAGQSYEKRMKRRRANGHTSP